MRLLLKRQSRITWALMSEGGFIIHTINNCPSQEEAQEIARVWASTWSAASIRLENEHEQAQRDRVSN